MGGSSIQNEYVGGNKKGGSMLPSDFKIIYKVISGSRAYGTNREDSDVDTRGVCIPPIDYYMGMREFDQYEDRQSDTVIYGIKKFFKLAYDCNPNIIELLYVPTDCVLECNYWGRYLIDMRDMFLSKKAYRTFGGYAKQQLHRIKVAKKWFDLRNDIDKLSIKDKIEFHKWKENRNPKRADLEMKYGYDTKHAMHLVRLLYTGIDILQYGTVIVKRSPEDGLIHIINGGFKYEEIILLADILFTLLDQEYERSKLPEVPSFEEINEKLIFIVQNNLKGR